MAVRRQRKVAELIHKEVSYLLQHRTRDPRLGFVTVTGVDLNRDLSVAMVYVALFDTGDDVSKNTMKALDNASGYLRRELGQVLSLRHVPNLVFKIDQSIEHGQRIEELLEIIGEEGK
jgi:ribosome-binding factor A